MKVSKMKQKPVAPVAAAKPTKTQKVAPKSEFPKVGSLLYKAIRGCALFLANIRKGDMKGQPFTAMPKATIPVVAWAQSEFGVCVSMVKAAGSVVALPEKELGFDMKQVGGECLSIKDATARAKKLGKPHVIHLRAAKKGVNETGILVGDLANQYVAWLNTSTGAFMTLETKALPGGRNEKRLFELVK